MAFKHEFFKIYDRKIASGEITFSKSGITKTDFTKICMEPDFIFEEEILNDICEKMKVSEEERDILYIAAGYKEKN
jgi:hypothetical protein